MKNVLITGGAGGIGSAITRAFAEHGYFVYIVDVDTQRSAALVDELGSNRCCALSLDVTDPTCLQEYAASRKDELALNHIVTLAGRALEDEWRPFSEQEPDVFLQSVRLNLLGHMNTVHAFLPALRRGEGDRSVVMISSVNASGCFGLPAYSAAKAGLTGFMNSMVEELGREGIRINTVSPGTVRTVATEAEPKDFDRLLQGAALNRFATTADVATAVYSVCDQLTALTGHELVLDAGQSRMHVH